jgi:predicted permease
MYRRERVRAGWLRAGLWYWHHAVALMLGFAREWIREWRGDMNMTTAFSRMDFKLALRMLARYPGLTLVGVLGMAVGITISAGAFSILYTLTDDRLPLPEGDRIVTVQYWDQVKNRPERRIARDLLEWRSTATSVQDLGAFRQVTRNLIASGARPEAVRLAEMSAAGFRVACVAPLLGRYLLESDEQAGAPHVLVIGYDVWRNRFGSDPAIVGRHVQLGDVNHEIVGVMPEGFAFPVNHRFWVPYRVDAGRSAPLQGPALTTFARLAPGVSLEMANAELQTLGERAASTMPDTHGKLRPRVLPYTFPFFEINDPSALWVVHVMQLVISLLLVIVCFNVGILVYARTATRHGEIALRAALGASRRRIVGQLFIEALVLAGAAAAMGLIFTAFGLRQVSAAMAEAFAGIPFWWTFELSPGVVVYTILLTVLAAIIVGCVPALQATGRRVQSGLKSMTSGGGSGMQLGRTWTLLVVVQVAIAVALLPAAVFHAWDSLRYANADVGFAAREFLATQVVTTEAGPPRDAALLAAVEADPKVAAVTFGSSAPGGEATAWIDVEGVEIPKGAAEQQGWVRYGTRAGHEARFNRIDLQFFDVFGVPVLAGRTFMAADTNPAARTVIVNEAFVRQILGGGQVLGRRVRYVGLSGDTTEDAVELGPWHEVVGVVPNFPTATEQGLSEAKLYHAARIDQVPGGVFAIHVRGGDATAFAGRLREIAAAVDPNLQLRNVSDLDSLLRQEQRMLTVVASVLGGVTVSVLLLAAAGIYALMSFTVSQRRKEIGIRAALGADPGRILRSIFARASWQLASGAVLGIGLAALLEIATDGGLMAGHGAVVLPIVASVMIAVGMLAACGPARRGLRVQPTEALRNE